MMLKIDNLHAAVDGKEILELSGFEKDRRMIRSARSFCALLLAAGSAVAAAQPAPAADSPAVSQAPAAEQGAQADPAPEQDIVVIGERLRRWRGRIVHSGGRSRCTVQRSSGDSEVDAIGCGAMTTCFEALQPRLVASADRGLDRRARRTMRTAFDRDMGACVAGEHDRLVEALAERRYWARQGNR